MNLKRYIYNLLISHIFNIFYTDFMSCIFAEDLSKQKETPPEFRVQMRDLVINIGEPATFDCQITGHPRPEIHWTRVSISFRLSNTPW